MLGELGNRKLLVVIVVCARHVLSSAILCDNDLELWVVMRYLNYHGDGLCVNYCVSRFCVDTAGLVVEQGRILRQQRQLNVKCGLLT